MNLVNAPTMKMEIKIQAWRHVTKSCLDEDQTERLLQSTMELLVACDWWNRKYEH